MSPISPMGLIFLDIKLLKLNKTYENKERRQG